MRIAIGWILLLLPIIAVVGTMFWDLGFHDAVLVLLLVVAILGCIVAGAQLIYG